MIMLIFCGDDDWRSLNTNAPGAMGAEIPDLCSGASWPHFRANAGSVLDHPGKTNRHQVMANPTGNRRGPNLYDISYRADAGEAGEEEMYWPDQR